MITVAKNPMYLYYVMCVLYYLLTVLQCFEKVLLDKNSNILRVQTCTEHSRAPSRLDHTLSISVRVYLLIFTDSFAWRQPERSICLR